MLAHSDDCFFIVVGSMDESDAPEFESSTRVVHTSQPRLDILSVRIRQTFRGVQDLCKILNEVFSSGLEVSF